MSIEFSEWPSDLVALYRQQGYWIDKALSDILDQQLATRGDNVAIICGSRQLTYAQLSQQSSQLACWLRKQGIEKHSTALVQLDNIAEFYIVFFALLSIGVVPANALFSHQRQEITAYVHQLQPSVIIASAKHSLYVDGAFFDELQKNTPPLKILLLQGESDFATTLESCIQQQEENTRHLQATLPEQVAFFQLSGGSTGTPKLIPRTHNDYYYSVRRSVEICRFTENTRYLCALPAPHNFSLSSPGALGVFYAGGTVVLASEPEPVECFTLIERHQVNVAALVPPAVSLWLQHAQAHRPQIHSLQLLQVGGASFSEALAHRVPVELGCQLQQVFGMAEGLVNYTRLDDTEDNIVATQGCPMCPHDELRVIDEEGRGVSVGETGVLLTRGPYTFRGYYKSPQHNKSCFDAEGFYCTGDLVQMTTDGYLRVVGRVKDQINRGGEKIAAEEIENLLLRHPNITHVALVAMVDEIMGEKSCAVIVSTDKNLRAVEIRKFLRILGVAQYKLPDRMMTVAEMPLTAVGKIDKKILRENIKHHFSIEKIKEVHVNQST